MRVAEVMHGDVITVEPDATFADAAKVLRDAEVSAVIVRNDQGVAAGIVTERDYVDLVAHGQDPSAVRVVDRMSTELVTCHSTTDIGIATRMMAERKIRHLPVVDDGNLVGIISIRDTVGRHPAL